jgi:hypothetical protein
MLMRRLFLLVVLLIVVVAVVGVLMLGAFPPAPATHPVQKVLPNDQFSHGS